MSIKSKVISIKEHRAFEGIISVIIIVSALTVGLKTYQLPEHIYATLVLLDHIVTAIFVIELGLRFVASNNAKEYFSSGWNWFDIVIVVGSLLPLGDSAQVARVIRVLRIMRLISFLPRLRVLINTFFEVLPQTFYLMVLNTIFFYIYAVIGNSAFAEINTALWGDLGRSMLTLFRIMTLEGWTQVMYETNIHYGWSWLYYVSFILLTAVVCLNLLVGVVVQVIEAQTKDENQSKLCEQCGHPIAPAPPQSPSQQH